MISENFIYLALLFNLSGASAYIFTTLKGETKPNRVTWLLWAFIPMIAFSAQLSEGVGKAVLFTFITGLGPFLIFIASFVNKKAYWKVGKFDIFCGSTSVLAITLWIITGNGVVALSLSILADFLAGLPTVVKAFNFPKTENGTSFLFATIGATITLLTLDKWEFSEYGFAVYIFLLTLIIFVLAKFRLGKIIKTQFST